MNLRALALAAPFLLPTATAGAASPPGGANPLSARLAAARPDSAQAPAAAASGLGVNLPLVARLIGAGPTLYISTVDVSNNTATAAQVDFYFNGVNLRTSVPVAVTGSISSAGALVAQGAGGTMRARSNAHFDDFIDSLVQAGMLPSSIKDDGFIGSTLFVFNGLGSSGQGSATVRFYNALAGGTVGQSLKGRELTASEPQSLVATVRDSRGKANTPQLYANIFINNMGVTANGVGTAGSVNVHVQAYANSTGQPVGTPLDTPIGAGQTVGISDVLASLKVPAGEDTVLVYVTVTSGTAAISGVFAQVDVTTRDGTTTDMSRADF
ncbi:MAG TPA: hypothetical protein VKH43_03365 [Thermoanaerobaculia bacterium]|nr:hypothetical protein [Thermoanaerobaculia bacterium]